MTAPFNTVQEVYTIMRRLLKTSSDQSISDETLRNALNRFYLYDMPQNLQLFELKRSYVFDTEPNIHLYQFPFDEYQLIRPAVYCDGVVCAFFESPQLFNNVFPEFIFNEDLITADGGPTYTGTVTNTPLLRGFVDALGYRMPNVIISGETTTGTRLFLVDQGTLSTAPNIANLYEASSNNLQDAANATALPTGTVNYSTGALSFTFSQNILNGSNIQVQTVNYTAGWPRAVLFFNNIIKVYPVPDKSYKMEFEAQITPAEFLSDEAAVPFKYMGEYLAYGAALKLLAEVGDMEQYQFYRGLFMEKEGMLLRRTNRQQAVERTPTIFSAQTNPTPNYYTQY